MQDVQDTMKRPSGRNAFVELYSWVVAALAPLRRLTWNEPFGDVVAGCVEFAIGNCKWRLV